ncbi:oxygenase MpaB family protein [Gordonia aurantiaca]|uniref:oxygenase MpaB family protein n=1 Tax=Gordonia sp. B21 TaxID=3151852 RepID=UPI003267370B
MDVDISLSHARSDEPRQADIGPGSLTWRIFGQRLLCLIVPYTGTLQNMHPAVGQSLQEVSNFFDDPIDRIVRSIPPIMGVVYDDPEKQTGLMVRDFHHDIKGHLPSGERYHALDPDTYWWTHATFIDTVITISKYFGTPLTEAEKDQLVREGVTWWKRYGLSMRPVIDNYRDFQAYWNRMHEQVLESNKTTDFATGKGGRSAMPKTLPVRVPAPLWRLAIEPAVRRVGSWLMSAMMSQRARDILGLNWSTTDELAFEALCYSVRLIWPRLPLKLRYFPRAYAAIQKHGL